MSIELNDASSVLAANTAELRSKNGWTQAQLAERAGLKRSTVTLVESGTGNPTMEVLLGLSAAFDLSIDELLSPPMGEAKLISEGEIKVKRKAHGRIEILKLLPDKSASSEIDLIRLKPGTRFAGTPHIKGTKEYLYCLSGTLEVFVYKTRFVVQQGELLTFPGDQPHSYAGIGRTLSIGVSVVLTIPR